MSLVVAQPLAEGPKSLALPSPPVEAEAESLSPPPPPPPRPSPQPQDSPAGPKAGSPASPPEVADSVKDEPAGAAPAAAGPAATPAVSPTMKTSGEQDKAEEKPPQPQQQPPPQQQQQQPQPERLPLPPGFYYQDKLDVSTSFALAAAQGIAAARTAGDAASRKRRERQAPTKYREFMDGESVDKADRNERRIVKRAKNRCVVKGW
jgi:hypothetical protein